MLDLVSDGMVRVGWAVAIANIHAPTVAECNASTDLTPRITPDGLGITPDTATVDTSSLASTFDTEGVGRRSYKNELTCKRGEGADDYAYDLLTYRTRGFLLVRRNVPYETPWAATQDVEVYPAQCGEPALEAPAKNEVQKFKSPLAVTDEPDARAVVAA
ncbi:phage tail tube protein [Yinghuangia aomiensis]